MRTSWVGGHVRMCERRSRAGLVGRLRAVSVPRSDSMLCPGVRGLSVCAAAKQAGAGFVMVTGRGARDAPRLGIASQFGADLAVDVDTADAVQALRNAT